jgi:acetaldehyde dehydrogenase (acetylating)
MRASRWDVILERAPKIIELVQRMTSVSRDVSASIGAVNDVTAFRGQLTAVEARQQSHADLLAAIAGQLDAITKASSAAAEKAQQALIVGGIATVLGLAALLVALLR